MVQLKNSTQISFSRGDRDIKDGEVVEEHPNMREVLQGDVAIRQHMADLIASSTGDVGSRCVAVWDGIFRLSLLRKNGIEFPSERTVYSEDLVFKLRALESSNIVSFLPNSYYEYHISESSYSKCVDVHVIDKLVSMYRMIECEFSETLDGFCFSSRTHRGCLLRSVLLCAAHRWIKVVCRFSERLSQIRICVIV